MIRKKDKSRSLPEINTTALPDIIFMLLFFFMVTTVMQPSKKGAPLVLPNTITDESTERTKPNELTIFLYNNDEHGQMLSIDGNHAVINNATSALNNAVVTMKENQNFPQKAILRIDQFTTMSAVNKIKELLQMQEILKIEYVHRKEA